MESSGNDSRPTTKHDEGPLPTQREGLTLTTTQEDDLRLAANSYAAVLISSANHAERMVWARQIHESSAFGGGPFVTFRGDTHPKPSENRPSPGSSGHVGGLLRKQFDQARGGTLFVDDIAELTVEVQRHLYAVLDEHEPHRLDECAPHLRNVRIIAGASGPLDAALAAGTFFEPLFYRLNVIHVDFLAPRALSDLRPVAIRVRDAMTTPPHHCAPEADLASVVKLMWDHDCGFVPVVEGSGIVSGVITDRDICMAAATRRRLPEDITAAESMSTLVHVCRPEDDITDALATMKQFRVRRLPVVDAAGRLQGVISINDVIRAAVEKRTPGAGEIVAAMAAICAQRPFHIAVA